MTFFVIPDLIRNPGGETKTLDTRLREYDHRPKVRGLKLKLRNKRETSLLQVKRNK